ncbi:DUF6202 family protein [Kribbella sp. NPDC051718]|uniref:DUF6202 family protein n=1 Tax=Kribbella sp. NPDC051718 TaxID=3155168 RepID=UPI00342EC2CE
MSQSGLMPEVGTDLEERVTQLIAAAGLARPDNRFFADAQSVQDVDPRAALRIAVAWQAMTRAFMFTTIASLGTLSARLATGDEPDREVLGAIQTAYSVIGDDMANVAPDFSAVAPAGAAGVHYVWWADTIVAPLAEHLGDEAVLAAAELGDGVTALIAGMQQLASAPLGGAVQLRVVEAIALDIAVAFRRIYSKVTLGETQPYRAPGALAWVDSHVKAEISHSKSVSDDETGMTAMAATKEEQEEFFLLAEEYTANWARALDEFDQALTAGH